MKKIILSVFSALFFGISVAAAPEPPQQLTGVEFLHEVVWHLYRWYLDERDAGKLAGQQDVVFWVRELHPKLDEGDKSLFGEIIIPDLNVDIHVKKADYTIPELKLAVKNDRFKITSVSRPAPETMPEDCTAVTMNYRALREYSHNNRAISRFPDNELMSRFQVAANEAITKYLAAPGHDEKIKKTAGGKNNLVYLAPVIEAANETWAFWPEGKLLIRFSSDSDLENPALWTNNGVAIHTYNIAEQTVVSLDEVPGSNAYMTRDQVGRIIFNCIVLGKPLGVTESRHTSRKHSK